MAAAFDKLIVEPKIGQECQLSRGDHGMQSREAVLRFNNQLRHW